MQLGTGRPLDPGARSGRVAMARAPNSSATPSRSRNLTVWLQRMHGTGVSAAQVGVGEVVDHRLAESALVVEHVVGDADALAGPDGRHGCPGRRSRRPPSSPPPPVVVELQRHADHLVAGPLQQRRHHGGIDPRPTWPPAPARPAAGARPRAPPRRRRRAGRRGALSRLMAAQNLGARAGGGARRGGTFCRVVRQDLPGAAAPTRQKNGMLSTV